MAANPINPTSHLYSLEEYFALEHAGEARYEYWEGELFCMSGGSIAHGIIVTNIVQRFGQRLASGPCRALTADVAIKTPTMPPYRYPDVSVVCGELRVETIHGIDVLLNPTLIVEVTSPTTESRDRGEKFAAYQQIASFQSYLLVAQNARLVSLYVRHPDGTWPSREFTGTESVVRLDSVGCELSLDEIYEGVVFSTVD
ncbi:MAG: Uma2 family endonuclease [Blastocatellia bacterium]